MSNDHNATAGCFAPLVGTLLAWRKAMPAAPFPLAGCGMLHTTVPHSLHEVTLPRLSAVAVLCGEKHVFAGGTEQVFPAGSIFILPSAVPCSVENIPDKNTGDYIALCMGFDDALVTKICMGLPSHLAGCNLPGELQNQPALVAVEVTASLARVWTHFIQCSVLLPQAHPAQEAIVEGVFASLAAEAPGLCQLQSGRSFTQRCLLLACMRPEHKWTADEMAGQLAVSARSLRRHLQLEGTTFCEVVRGARLTAALGMLQGRLATVSEVAARCGYDSPSRFAALFRQRFGISPAEVLRCNAPLGPIVDSN